MMKERFFEEKQHSSFLFENIFHRQSSRLGSYHVEKSYDALDKQYNHFALYKVKPDMSSVGRRRRNEIGPPSRRLRTMLTRQQQLLFSFCSFILFLTPTTTFGIMKQQTKPSSSPPDRPQLVIDALEKNRPIHYFGLGSNMSRKKLENRGINGTKIEIQTMEAAVVPNYRLAFNLRGFPPIEPGMGSLEPVSTTSSTSSNTGGSSTSSAASRAIMTYKHNECHGALVKLTPENYEKVMRSEGVGSGRSDQGYEEIVIDAYPYNRPNRPVKAVALRARPHVRLKYDPCPSARYMSILKEGAKELGLRPCYQEFLQNHPVQALSSWQRKEAIYNLIFTFSLSSMLNWRGITRFQSNLLFMVYQQPSASTVARALGDTLTTLILLPGAIIGFVIYHISKIVGKTPPFVTRFLAVMDKDFSSSSASS
jgi:hypothetical protein